MSEATHELGPDERRAIASLKRLARRWPSTLWLFAGGSGGDSLTILRTGSEGERVQLPDHAGIDQSYIVGYATIPSDGGDW